MTDLNECQTQFPCENGAECMNLFGSFMCLCQLGFEGDNCEINRNDCENNQCWHVMLKGRSDNTKSDGWSNT